MGGHKICFYGKNDNFPNIISVTPSFLKHYLTSTTRPPRLIILRIALISMWLSSIFTFLNSVLQDSCEPSSKIRELGRLDRASNCSATSWAKTAPKEYPHKWKSPWGQMSSSAWNKQLWLFRQTSVVVSKKSLLSLKRALALFHHQKARVTAWQNILICSMAYSTGVS